MLKIPNSPIGHLKVAKAYFERGASGDSLRLSRHLNRAIELNPGAEVYAKQILSTTRFGYSPKDRTNEEMFLDERLEGTFPESNSNEDTKDPLVIIKKGLAKRMLRGEFRISGESFEENLDAVKNIFGVGEKDQSEITAFRKRLKEISAYESHSDNWISNLKEELNRLLIWQRKLLDITKSSEVSDARNPVYLKNEAFLASGVIMVTASP